MTEVAIEINYEKLVETMPLRFLIDVILIVNGLYDLTCACSILWLGHLPGFSVLSNLHAGMFEEHVSHPVIRRLLAYWLLTYGMVRTMAGLYGDHVLSVVGALTYFIEAFSFEYESRVGETMVRSKVTFVSVTSLFLGVVVWTRSTI
jgi:hypothetical protein